MKNNKNHDSNDKCCTTKKCCKGKIIIWILLFAGLVFGAHYLFTNNHTNCIEDYKQNSPISEKKEMQTAVDKKMAFETDKWDFVGEHRIEKYLGRDALVLNPKGFGMATLKDSEFENGVIEYDIAFPDSKKDESYDMNFPNGRMFGGIRFRTKSPGTNESFYMRSHNSGKADANQYTPDYNDLAGWQLYYGENYSAQMEYPLGEWMHVKLVISDQLADIYIMDMNKPALTVELKQITTSGKIALWSLNMGSEARFANFEHTSTDSVKITGKPKALKEVSKGTIMSYQVSNGFNEASLDNKFQLSESDKKDLNWTKLDAEKTGLVNLAQLQKPEENKDTVFAKVNINSEKDQIKKLDFGFSDRVRVYLNNKLLFAGHDEYASRDHRFLGTIGYYDSIYLDLNKGDNELILAITEPIGMSGGWGVQGKFEDMENLSL